MPAKQNYDPLKAIPSASAVQQRLEEIEEQARWLRILLRTAQEIEQDWNTAAERREANHGA